MTLAGDIRMISAAGLRLVADMLDGPERLVSDHDEPVGGDAGEASPPTEFCQLPDSVILGRAADVIDYAAKFTDVAMTLPPVRTSDQSVLDRFTAELRDRAAQFEVIESDPDQLSVRQDDLAAHIFGSWHATGASWSDVARELLADFYVTKK
ncbi:hypothetical protein [Mycobacterium aquaticum]|uniref:Uncharacterized protein n=1 Tax=Mycobacterium aquaticum TaxID=1927124 RepID=A0A1X0A0M5_9MYCO|nr:hypothetical protein [Mycobacterium aquaticum]ORA23428.1 hypothetical protein BST13_35345 [Mycobacterium aquaticum]